MKARATLGLVVLGSILIGSALAQAPSEPTLEHGKQVFDLWCGGCHKRLATGAIPIAGTSSLQRKYQGSEPAALEDRTDLNAGFIKNLVRHGYKSMPASRKTEISDADLDALADYLTRKR